MVVGVTGARRYQLYKPPGSQRGERLPLVVMLHGCTQDAHGMAASSRMNRIAAGERFMVLYPEQDRMSNLQGCWNWFDTRNGRAQREADAMGAAINQVCLTQPVDPDRIAIAGFSAGPVWRQKRRMGVARICHQCASRLFADDNSKRRLKSQAAAMS